MKTHEDAELPQLDIEQALLVLEQSKVDLPVDLAGEACDLLETAIREIIHLRSIERTLITACAHLSWRNKQITDNLTHVQVRCTELLEGLRVHT